MLDLISGPEGLNKSEFGNEKSNDSEFVLPF